MSDDGSYGGIRFSDSRSSGGPVQSRVCPPCVVAPPVASGLPVVFFSILGHCTGLHPCCPKVLVLRRYGTDYPFSRFLQTTGTSSQTLQPITVPRPLPGSTPQRTIVVHFTCIDTIFPEECSVIVLLVFLLSLFSFLLTPTRGPPVEVITEGRSEVHRQGWRVVHLWVTRDWGPRVGRTRPSIPLSQLLSTVVLFVLLTFCVLHTQV